MPQRLLAIVAVLFAAAVCLGQSKPAYLDLDGGRLYYEECGSGPSIVLLHDGLLHSTVWDDVWPKLCSSDHVIRYDRRGYGRSTPATAPFAPEDDLLRLMRHCNVSRATLVGSSSGAAIAIDFAIAHPERVEALFLIGPVVHGMRSSDYFFQRGSDASAAAARGDFAAAAEAWSKDRFQVSGERPEARKKILETLRDNPQNLRVAGQFELRPSPPSVTRLWRVRAPTLMIVGEDDIADVHAFSGAIQAALPVVRREVWKGAGHLVQMEKPDEIVARLQTFIAVAERKTVAVADATLRGYTGRYALPGSRATVALKHHQLILQINGDADIPLFAESAARFLVRTTGAEIEFERSAAGKTTAMLVHNPNANPVRCPRVSSFTGP